MTKCVSYFEFKILLMRYFGNRRSMLMKGPVCLCEFARMGDKLIRVLGCGHALCACCLEAWAVHCTKAHLNPSRFGMTRNGRVIAWTPGPKCPLCCARVNCVPKEDLRQAVIAAIGHRGVALSTFVAYQNRTNVGPATVFTHAAHRTDGTTRDDDDGDDDDETDDETDIVDEGVWHRSGSARATW